MDVHDKIWPPEAKRLISQEYLSHQEIAVMTEANSIRDESFQPISDAEEDYVQP